MQPSWSKITRRAIAATAAATGLLVCGGPAYGWVETMHQKQLTKAALQLVELRARNGEYSPEIWDEALYFGSAIMRGARDEDFPCELIKLWRLRANNHYAHAIQWGVGLSCSAVPRGDRDTDALYWAKTNPFFNELEEFNDGKQWWHFGWNANDLSNGNMSWQEAVNRYGYTRESKRLAYYTLGFVLHLLQDMGCPEHVHDDPHGGSSFTGFEMVAHRDWDTFNVRVQTLQPWRPATHEPGKHYHDLDAYFMRLGRLAYSASRFKGYSGNDPTRLDQDSDLGKMFRIERVTNYQSPNMEGTLKLEQPADGWALTNHDPARRRILTGDIFKYLPRQYGADPLSHKGELWECGEWWPTSREMENVSDIAKKDEPGYYYVELSSDVMPYRSRDLLPAAYLPSPLPSLSEEDARLVRDVWRRDKLDAGETLYSVTARSVAPHIITHSAGLIQHYFEIVNHPPFAKRVVVYDAVDEEVYRACWDNEPSKPRVPGGNIRDITKRKLTGDATVEFGSEQVLSEALRPGKARIWLEFSEPVKDPSVRIDTVTPFKLKAVDPEHAAWSGNFEIPEKGPSELKIAIRATDLHRHFADSDSQLDPNPATPARRIARNGSYSWDGSYEPGGVDLNHTIKIARDTKRSTRYVFFASPYERLSPQQVPPDIRPMPADQPPRLGSAGQASLFQHVQLCYLDLDKVSESHAFLRENGETNVENRTLEQLGMRSLWFTYNKAYLISIRCGSQELCKNGSWGGGTFIGLGDGTQSAVLSFTTEEGHEYQTTIHFSLPPIPPAQLEYTESIKAQIESYRDQVANATDNRGRTSWAKRLLMEMHRFTGPLSRAYLNPGDLFSMLEEEIELNQSIYRWEAGSKKEPVSRSRKLIGIVGRCASLGGAQAFAVAKKAATAVDSVSGGTPVNPGQKADMYRDLARLAISAGNNTAAAHDYLSMAYEMSTVAQQQGGRGRGPFDRALPPLEEAKKSWPANFKNQD